MKQIYSSNALTLNEQLELLSRRGVIVQDPTSAKQYLSSTGFYRLYSYVKPLLAESKVVNFESAWHLYLFDRKLRLIMLDAIEKIEVAFRVAISERMSIQYGVLCTAPANVPIGWNLIIRSLFIFRI